MFAVDNISCKLRKLSMNLFFFEEINEFVNAMIFQLAPSID